MRLRTGWIPRAFVVPGCDVLAALPAAATLTRTTAQTVTAAAILPMVAITVWLAATSEHLERPAAAALYWGYLVGASLAICESPALTGLSAFWGRAWCRFLARDWNDGSVPDAEFGSRRRRASAAVGFLGAVAPTHEPMAGRGKLFKPASAGAEGPRTWAFRLETRC